MIKALELDHPCFWATHQGAELDLLALKGQRRLGIEVKRADAPTITRSMRIALEQAHVVVLGLVELLHRDHPHPGLRAHLAGLLE